MDEYTKKVMLEHHLVDAFSEANQAFKDNNSVQAEQIRRDLISSLDNLVPYKPAEKIIDYLQVCQWIKSGSVKRSQEEIKSLIEENAN